jgi:hypothetical protein
MSEDMTKLHKMSRKCIEIRNKINGCIYVPGEGRSWHHLYTHCMSDSNHFNFEFKYEGDKQVLNTLEEDLDEKIKKGIGFNRLELKKLHINNIRKIISDLGITVVNRTNKNAMIDAIMETQGE